MNAADPPPAAMAATPAPVPGHDDRPLWESIARRAMALQRCAACGHFQYPPAPLCECCLRGQLDWTPVSGEGLILSWVIYHKTYLPAYPAPYNVIAVQLEEGPVFISNLQGAVPRGDWIGRAVRLVYHEMPDGMVLPRFVLTH